MSSLCFVSLASGLSILLIKKKIHQLLFWFIFSIHFSISISLISSVVFIIFSSAYFVFNLLSLSFFFPGSLRLDD